MADFSQYEDGYVVYADDLDQYGPLVEFEGGEPEIQGENRVVYID